MERFAINILHQKIQNICRLCGVDNPNKVYIIEQDDVICVDDDEDTLVKKIEECVGIKVQQNDQMPQQICSLCIDKINDFYEYRLMCAATNTQTRTVLNLPLVQPTSGVIKIEPKTEPSQEVTVPADSKSFSKQGRGRPRKKKSVDDEDSNDASGGKRVKIENVCQYCNEAFDKSTDLERHLVVKHTPLIRRFGCGTCAELFDTAAEYKEHNLWHKLTRTAYNCYRCKRRFVRSAALCKHLEINNCLRSARKTLIRLVPDLRCKLCNKIFKTQNLYEWHKCFMKARTNCPKCGKYFLKKNLLIRHYVLYCTGTRTPMEPAVVLKEELATGALNGFPDGSATPLAESEQDWRRKGLSQGAAETNVVEPMKEETTELPFTLDQPVVKMENTCSDGDTVQDVELESERRKRAKVTFEEEADKIHTLLQSGAGVDETTDYAEISSLLNSVNEAIATISNATKKKKHKDTATSSVVENIGEDFDRIHEPMVVISMAHMEDGCENPGIPQASDAPPLNGSEPEAMNRASADRTVHEANKSNDSNAEGIDGDAGCDVGGESPACCDENDSNDDMEDDANDFGMEEATSSVENEVASPNSNDKDSPDAIQPTMPAVQVKREPIAYHSDSDADVGEYETAIACLAIKHEPAEEEACAQENSVAAEPSHHRKQTHSKRTSSYQALRIKIKKEKGLLAATVVDQESDPVRTTPSPDVAEPENGVSSVQTKPTRIPNHFKIRPMRTRPTVDSVVHVKQERFDACEYQQDEENETEEAHPSFEEEHGSVRVKEESLDSLAWNSNVHQSANTPPPFVLRPDDGFEAEIAFAEAHIKQERNEETPMTVCGSVTSNDTTDEPSNLAGESQAKAPQDLPRLDNTNDAENPRPSSKTKRFGTTSHKSNRRINPFALLNRKSLVSATAPDTIPFQQSGSDPERSSLPVIAQVTSINIDEHLAEPLDSIFSRVDNNTDIVQSVQPNDSEVNEPTEEPEEQPAPTTGETSCSVSGTVPEKESVVNDDGQHETTHVASVSMVRESYVLAEETISESNEGTARDSETGSSPAVNRTTSLLQNTGIGHPDNESTSLNMVNADDKAISSEATSESPVENTICVQTETVLSNESDDKVAQNQNDVDKSECLPHPAEPTGEESVQQPLEEDPITKQSTTEQMNNVSDSVENEESSKVTTSAEHDNVEEVTEKT